VSECLCCYDGQKVATGKSSNAVFTSSGTVVSMASNTIVKLGRRNNELLDGVVVVSSEAGTATKVSDFTISTPAGAHGKFLATIDGDGLRLLALEGRVELTDTQKLTQPVPAATGVKIKLPTKDKDSDDSRRLGGRSWLSNDDIGLLIVLAAAVTAGVTLGIVNSQNSSTLSTRVP
jgi:hypothetical protein